MRGRVLLTAVLMGCGSSGAPGPDVPAIDRGVHGSHRPPGCEGEDRVHDLPVAPGPGARHADVVGLWADESGYIELLYDGCCVTLREDRVPAGWTAARWLGGRQPVLRTRAFWVRDKLFTDSRLSVHPVARRVVGVDGVARLERVPPAVLHRPGPPRANRTFARILSAPRPYTEDHRFLTAERILPPSGNHPLACTGCPKCASRRRSRG